MAVSYKLQRNRNQFFRFSDSAYPGPQIGFLQEVVAWLDYHTKGMNLILKRV